jgi:DNA-binding LacI/PurR family transcriptional regulator
VATTLMDVARLAGVSRAAASRVLGSHGGKMDIAVATQERIREAARKLNYVRDARAGLLRGATSPMLGVLVDGLEKRLRPTILNHLAHTLQSDGLEVLLGVHERDMGVARHHVNTFRAYRTFGTLTISGQDTIPDELAHTLIEGQGECGPWVAVFFTNRRTGVPSVTLDVRGVVTEFLELACADGRAHTMVAGVQNAAFDYCSTIFAREASRYPGIGSEVLSIPAGNSRQMAEKVCLAIQERCSRGPVVVLVFEDSHALAISVQLRRMGVSIPEQAAIVGYGNWDIASLCDPSLTTFDVAGILPDMAAKVFELISEVGAGGRPEAVEHVFKPTLKIRESFRPKANL